MHNYGMLTNWKLKTENESTLLQAIQTKRSWRSSEVGGHGKTKKGVITYVVAGRCISRTQRYTPTSNKSTRGNRLRAPSE